MLIYFTILVVIIGQTVIGVNRNLFKSCAQSGFCNRNRVIAENILNEGYLISWEAEEIKIHGSELKFKISRSNTELDVSLQYLRNGVLKLSVEPCSLSSRYKIPKGDVIIDDTGSVTNYFEQNDTDKNIYQITGTELSVHIKSSPFSIVLLSESDGEILSLNSKNLLNYEIGSSFMVGEIVSSIDEKRNAELWDEPIFSHKNPDSRPKGPTSMGMDITFSKSKAIYGIPEHSTALALESTRGVDESVKKIFTKTDPYRLFNLDVFEYELDSTMALYGAIPIMLGHDPKGSSHRSVGVFWNNPSETWVDIYDGIQENGKFTHWMSESGSFSLYLFAGKNIKELQQNIVSLTGSPQLPPLFSLGYHQCRWNYKSVDDVLDVHRNFDKYALPVDVIWLDIEHTADKKYMTWHPSNFANPEKMIEELGRAGRKLVTIVDPHLKKSNDWEIYQEVISKNLAVKGSDGKSNFEGDCWPGKSVWTDYTDPKARHWWASLFDLDKYKKSNENVYIWNDMNEPSVFNSPEITMPRDNIHFNETEHRDIHNLYGMYQQMSTFKGLLDRSKGLKRPFLLSRSFYASSHRFGAVWTGDNLANWSHLKASGPMLMSLGIVSYHFAGADVGGFFGNPSTELLVRWYQAGAMQPFFRAHAHIETNRREPWLFGETVTNLIRKILRLRYSLLPVWYTAMEESSRSGVPPMRPMILEFPDDEKMLNIDDQWMIGSFLLFKPITSEGQKSAHILLPKNQIWYNYFNSTAINSSSGDIVENDLDLNRMLLYIRGGSIFPRKDIARRSSSAMKFDPLTLVIALDENGNAKGNLYVDDGDSFDYQNNMAFARIELNATIKKDANILILGLNVIGEASLLSDKLLRVNEIFLIETSGHKKIPVDLYMGKSGQFDIPL